MPVLRGTMRLVSARDVVELELGPGVLADVNGDAPGRLGQQLPDQRLAVLKGVLGQLL